jgi:acetyl esterase/lipase
MTQWRLLSVLALMAPIALACGKEEGPTPAGPPLPRVGGTPETDALAGAPHRCGQAPFRWLDDAALGDVTASGESKTFPAASLALIAAVAQLEIPETTREVVVEQLAYLTQDRGKTIEATTLVAHPVFEDDAPRPLDVLLLLHGTSGFKDGCGVSGDPQGQALAAALAALGYVVVAPDYIGLKAFGAATGFLHPYLVAQPTALSSLDAVRAARKLPGDRVSGHEIRPRVLVFGGSQGGHAALWVDRLAPYYARELELLGTVATTPPSDTTSHITRAILEKVPATANTLAFFGTAPAWYGLEASLEDALLPPWPTRLPELLASSCSDFGEVGDVGLDDLFSETLRDDVASSRFGETPLGCVTRESSLLETSIPRIGPSSPSYGVLVVAGAADTLVSAAIERAAFETMCRAGLPARYLECEGAKHVEATTWSIPNVLSFLRERESGTPMVADCDAPPPERCLATP